ncbi:MULTISPECIES: hypothetical protein [unclassified Paraburkholderia]|uniref:hypothetical protein n=1 Tax=unclassified Paraburkholderia TaxID=2615204 RepID=UPI001611513C|nr:MULTISPECIES: hypothetical protein [unclassified Paraburkholderia]MBB5448363.1 MFS family permease [Paraburkholderia sp. WSM4177]MBB5488744.1 MFS family permease [Paraburkholderia sp. WSM4180]
MKGLTREGGVFLFCSTAYRLASGALLVSLTWTILNQHEGGYLPLAFAIFCSFIPAFITPALVRRFSSRMNGRQMSVGFLGCLAVLSVVAGVSRNSTAALLAANLMIWLIFMLLEASLDMWFTQVQRGVPEALVRRISGATTASSQAALMVGPLLAAGFTPILGGLGFSVLLAAVFLLVGMLCHTRNGNTGAAERTQDTVSAPRLPLAVFVPMVLIWPTLGAFNFMLPVYVAKNGWALFELGVLDAAFGLGMALIGLLIILGALGKGLIAFLSGLVALAFAAIGTWLLVADSLLPKAISLLILGMAFGGIRVHIRAAIAFRYSEAAVGRCVSQANALATPVLLLILIVQLVAIESAWLLPFLMIVLSIGLLMQASATRFAQDGEIADPA